jgi:hypothetical protein
MIMVKGKPKKKMTRVQHDVMMTKMRQNPAFLKAEREQTLRAEIGIEYISLVLKGLDAKAHLESHAEDVERLGGLTGLHDFLEAFELLSWDYEDHFDEDGLLKPEGVNKAGREFVEENDKDKEKAS